LSFPQLPFVAIHFVKTSVPSWFVGIYYKKGKVRIVIKHQPEKEDMIISTQPGKDDDSCSEDSCWTSTSQDQHSSAEHSRTSSTSLAASETRVVRRSKTIVHICLIVAGLGVGVLVYFLVKHQEQNTFKTEVIPLGHLIVDRLFI